MDENQWNQNDSSQTMQEYDYTPQNNYNQPDPGYNLNGEQDQSVPGFFMQLPYSLQPPKYGQLMRVKRGAMIWFIILLLFVLTVLSYIQFRIRFNIGDSIEKALDKAPDFALENGVLWLEDDYLYDDTSKGLYIEASKDTEEFSMDDAKALHEKGNYSIVLLISKRNLVYADSDTDYQNIDFKNFSGFNFDRRWILNSFVPVLSALIAAGFVFYFLWRCVWYFFCALVYMLLSMIFARIFNRQISAGILYKSSVYAKVLMTLVAFVISLIPVSIPIPPFFRTMITIGMIIFAFQFLPEKYETEI